MEYKPYKRGLVNDTLVAYTFAGEELWRVELDADANVGPLLALDSGDLVYVDHRDRNPTIAQRDRTGGIVWEQTLKSAGEYAHVNEIDMLKNGRLAIVGWTGPPGMFVAQDTDALLLVSAPLGGELLVPAVRSAIH